MPEKIGETRLTRVFNGAHIRKIRRYDRGITMKQLAEAVGCSEQAISQYERGERSMDVYTCKRILDALGCTAHDVLVKEDEEKIQRLEAQVPKWISVEERLPEVSDIVLVIANGQPRPNISLINAVLIASYWAEEGWIAEGYEGWESISVSHWMPLPEPPKEG